MAEKGLNCGINKTSIMATKITVPDIGDFENVEVIEILAKPGSIIKSFAQYTSQFPFLRRCKELQVLF